MLRCCGVRIVAVAGLTLCAVVSMTLNGCSSKREVAGQTATRTVREFQTSLDSMPPQIDRVMGTLNELTSGDPVDHAQLTRNFSNQLRTLKQQAQTLAVERDRAESSTQTYFRRWVQETRGISNTADRDAALAAIDQGRVNTDTAMTYLRNGTRDFRSLVDRLTAIETQLGTNPSPATVQTISRNLGPVVDNSIAVKNYIARLNEQIDMSPTGR